MELVWAKVPGWSWWPAVVLPVPENGRETRGNKAITKVEENERIVLFLVDKTVARVPRELPAFTQHYTRFLSATYANKKLFQAVEEARALAYEGSAAAQPGAAEQLPQISYPPPVRDDFRKTGRQLLQWLRAAAVDPLAPVNKLSDQANKRVLHAVRSNRRLAKDVKPFVLPPEVPAAIGPASAAPAADQRPANADATTEQLPAKRQRRPHSWLQQYGDLPPALTQSTRAAASAQQHPAGTKSGAVGANTAGCAAAASKHLLPNSSMLAGKANGHLARFKQPQHKPRDLQQRKAAASDNDVPAGARAKNRKRARSTTADGLDAAEDTGSEDDEQYCNLLSDSNTDDDNERQMQQRRLHDRALGANGARKHLGRHHGPGEQQHIQGKQRRLMDLMALCETAKSGGVSTAAAAAAAVAAAFRGGRAAHRNAAAAGSSGIDEGHVSRPQAGSKGSGTRVGRKSQQQQMRQQVSDSESDADSDLLNCLDGNGCSRDPSSRAFSRFKQRYPATDQGDVQMRYSMQRQPQRAGAVFGPAVDGDLRCYSPQLLRQPGIPASSRCTCCCCYCQIHHHQQQQMQSQWQQRQQHVSARMDTDTDQVLGDWLQNGEDLLDADGGLQQQQHQQQVVGDADGDNSLVDVQALRDQGLFSSAQEGCLAQPGSLITAAGAPLRPTAVRPSGAGSSRSCSIPYLRPASPLLGAAPVVTVGDELLPGLEEDLQHAAAIFGSNNGRKSSCPAGQQQQSDDVSGHGNRCDVAAAAPVEGYTSDGASAAAADSTALMELDLQPALLTDEAGAAVAGAGGIHPESPSTASHDTLLLPNWELDVIKTGPQDSELQAEIAAAAAASCAGAAKAVAIEIPPVLGFKRSLSQRSASSTGEDVRRLALARCGSSNKTPDLQTQLEDCKEQLHASTEIVRQLKQQLDTKDEQIAALCSQTSAQAKQLQQQAGELMALRALLGKQQKLPASAGTATATAAGDDAPSSSQQAGVNSDGATAAGTRPTGSSQEAEQADGTAAVDAAAAGNAVCAPTRRSGRLSAAAARAAVKDLLDLSDAAGTAGDQKQPDAKRLQDQDACLDANELKLQLSQAKAMIHSLEKQLQQTTKQASAATKQQQTEAEQLRSWLQAAEIDAVLMRSENELLKKVLPSSVVASVAATAARKPAERATAGRGKAGEGGSNSRKQSGGRATAAGKAAAAQQKAGAAANGKTAATGTGEGNGSMTAAVTGQAAAAVAAQQVVASHAALTAACTQTSALAVAAAGGGATAAAANKACNVFGRRPKLQLPLQAIALPTSNAANAQTLAAALAALKDAAAGGNGMSGGSSSNNSILTRPGTAAVTAINSPTAAAASTGTTLLSLATAAGGTGVSTVGGPVVVFRPSGALQLATMLQVNAALSQLAAANAATSKQPAAAVAPLVLKPPTPCPAPPAAAAAAGGTAAGVSGSTAAAAAAGGGGGGGGGGGSRGSSRPAVLMLGDAPPPSSGNSSVLTAIRACANSQGDNSSDVLADKNSASAADCAQKQTS